jgi:hypothetical protein
VKKILIHALVWIDEKTYEWRIWKPLNAVINHFTKEGPR